MSVFHVRTDRASDEFNIPEIKLVRAIHDSLLFRRFTHGKEKYVSYIRRRVETSLKDNVFTTVWRGHFFLQKFLMS